MKPESVSFHENQLTETEHPLTDSAGQLTSNNTYVGDYFSSKPKPLHICLFFIFANGLVNTSATFSSLDT